MYDIANLKRLERELEAKFREHFFEFFNGHDYSNDSRMVVAKDVRELDDIEALYYGNGFYVILTDYQLYNNQCRFVMDGLKAIYRGHCYTVRDRMMSHLFNDHYRATLPEKGTRYDVCMKLDGNNGINISKHPYSASRWRVVVHKMNGSSKQMREQAELAFDDAFSRPLGSREAFGK